jgi:hypothetical protein
MFNINEVSDQRVAAVRRLFDSEQPGVRLMIREQHDMSSALKRWFCFSNGHIGEADGCENFHLCHLSLLTPRLLSTGIGKPCFSSPWSFEIYYINVSSIYASPVPH